MILINVIGRLCKEVMLYKKQNGMQDIYYTNNCVVANVYAGKNEKGEAQETSVFYNFVLFGTQAQNFCKYAEKGQQIFISGKLQIDFYNDKNGQLTNSESLSVNNFTLLAKPLQKDNTPQNTKKNLELRIKEQREEELKREVGF